MQHPPRWRGAALVLLLAGCLGACAKPVAMPPLTAEPTGEEHPGKFVWFDLLTEDTAAAKGFYGDVFGWTFSPYGDEGDYDLIRNGDTVIGGLAEVEERDTEVSESLWLATLSVEDVDAAVAVVQEQGGTVVVKPEDVPGRGRLAAVRDPSGAPLILLRAEGGDPVDGPRPPGTWLWTDFWTNDADAARGFYAALVGFESKPIEAGEGHVYHVLGRDGRARAGLVDVRALSVEPNWLPYVRVDDVAEIMERTRAGGGRVLLHTRDTAVLIDPAGAAIGVQSHRRLGRKGS